MRIAHLLTSIAALLANGCIATAQQTPDIAQGLQAFQSYHGGEIDSVNLANGNLNLHIPLISYPQRGGKLTLSFNLIWNGKPWVPTALIPLPLPKGTTQKYAWLPSSDKGLLLPTYPEGLSMNVADTQDIQSGESYFLYAPAGTSDDIETFTAQWLTADGSLHSGFQASNGGLEGQISMDGSGLFNGYLADNTCSAHCYSTDSNGISYDVNWLQYYGNPSAGPLVVRQDANGNQITSQVNQAGTTIYTDTVGRVIPAPPTSDTASTSGDPTGCPGPLPIYSVATWQVPGANGSSLTFKFCYVQVVISLPEAPPSAPAINATDVYLQGIVLPNQQTWKFEYNGADAGDQAGYNYGDLSKVTFPTGGSISYQYQLGSGYNYSYSSNVIARSEDANDGNGARTWTYSRNMVPLSPTTTVTNPDSTQVVHTFSSLDGNTADSAYEVNTQTYQGTAGSAPLLEGVQTAYNFTPFTDWGAPAYAGGIFNVFPSSKTTTLGTAPSTVTTYAYCCTVNVSPLGMGSMPLTYGKQSDVKLYDYTGLLLKDTQTNYMFNASSAYLQANLLNLPQSVSVLDANGNTVSSTTFTYDQAGPAYSGVTNQHIAPPPGAALGNESAVTHWLNTGTSPQTSKTWLDTGEILNSMDAWGCSTTYGYSSAYAGSLPTSVTNCLNQAATYGYDLGLGLKTSSTDPNNQTTTMSYDSLGRVVDVLRPDVYPGTNLHGETKYCYNDAAAQCSQSDPVNAVRISEAQNPTSTIVEQVEVDGMGRKTQEALLTDPQSPVLTTTTYDSLGRVGFVSNPYRSLTDASYGGTTFAYDALNRKTSATHSSDGTSLSWVYTGNMTDSYDESLRHWQRTTDAAGRLTNVLEPDPASNTPSLSTTYQYDELDNLISVNQTGNANLGEVARNRSFTYDSLSRLVASNNPETGSITYGYTNSGSFCAGDVSLPCSKTDARSITTTFAYDRLSRLTLAQAPGLSRGYAYDGSQGTQNAIGRLAWASNESNADEIYGYDAMGRMNWQASWTPSSPNHTGNIVQADYDVAGGMIDLYYPDGRHITQGWDGAAHLNNVTYADFGGDPVNYPYFAGATYWPSGAPEQTTLGNGVSQTYSLNGRLQECRIQASFPIPGGAQPVIDKQYFFGSGGTLCGSTPGNNGNIFSIVDGLNASRTQGFQYDQLNRIASASSSDGAFNYSYPMDSFGNMQQVNNLTGNPAVSFTANNQMQVNVNGYAYDASGNLIDTGSPEYGGHHFTYDAESQVTQLDYGNSATYTLDGNGQRVRKDVASSGTWTEYTYFAGQPIAEKHSDGSWTDLIYADGRKIAEAPTAETVVTISGTASGVQGQYEYFPIPTSLAGYTVQAGDKLQVRQRQHGSASGGINLNTDQAASSDWSYQGVDQDGMSEQQDTTPDGEWHDRIFDISGMAGNHITVAYFCDLGSGGGAWSIDFTDFAIISADGGVHPIYTGAGGIGMSWWGSPGMTNNGYAVAPVPTDAAGTRYYADDHLGTARMEFSSGGWPVWSGTFAPYGEEINPQATANNYKFTGKERDAESGNDYFGARYFSSTMGRFMSPDWAAKAEPVPYAKLDNPQSLNIYAYVLNNPLRFTDADGHEHNGCPATHGCASKAGATLKQAKQWAADHPRTVSAMKAGVTAVATVGVAVAIVATAPVSVPATLGAAAVVGLTTAAAGIAAAGGAVATAAYAAGAITGDTKGTGEAAEAVQTVSNPVGLAVAIGTGGNMGAAQTAAAASDLLTGGKDALTHVDKAIAAAGSVATAAVHAGGAATAVSAAQSLANQ